MIGISPSLKVCKLYMATLIPSGVTDDARILAILTATKLKNLFSHNHTKE